MAFLQGDSFEYLQSAFRSEEDGTGFMCWNKRSFVYPVFLETDIPGRILALP